MDESKAQILPGILAIQIFDSLFYLADFLGLVVHLSEIMTIRFDRELLVVFF